MNGLETRSLGPDDIDDVIALWRECEELDDGEAVTTHADYVAVAQRPSFDFGRHTIGVRDDGRLVAVGLLFDERAASALAWRLPNRECGLSTDSRTGARRLYEHVGMRGVRSYTQYARPL